MDSATTPVFQNLAAVGSAHLQYLGAQYGVNLSSEHFEVDLAAKLHAGDEDILQLIVQPHADGVLVDDPPTALYEALLHRVAYLQTKAPPELSTKSSTWFSLLLICGTYYGPEEMAVIEGEFDSLCFLANTAITGAPAFAIKPTQDLVQSGLQNLPGFLAPFVKAMGVDVLEELIRRGQVRFSQEDVTALAATIGSATTLDTHTPATAPPQPPQAPHQQSQSQQTQQQQPQPQPQNPNQTLLHQHNLPRDFLVVPIEFFSFWNQLLAFAQKYLLAVHKATVGAQDDPNAFPTKVLEPLVLLPASETVPYQVKVSLAIPAMPFSIKNRTKFRHLVPQLLTHEQIDLLLRYLQMRIFIFTLPPIAISPFVLEENVNVTAPVKTDPITTVGLAGTGTGAGTNTSTRGSGAPMSRAEQWRKDLTSFFLGFSNAHFDQNAAGEDTTTTASAATTTATTMDTATTLSDKTDPSTCNSDHPSGNTTGSGTSGGSRLVLSLGMRIGVYQHKLQEFMLLLSLYNTAIRTLEWAVPGFDRRIPVVPAETPSIIAPIKTPSNASASASAAARGGSGAGANASGNGSETGSVHARETTGEEMSVDEPQNKKQATGANASAGTGAATGMNNRNAALSNRLANAAQAATQHQTQN